MAGEAYLEIDVLMNSSLSSDAKKAETGLNAVDGAAKRSTASLSAAELVSKKTAREMQTLARSGTAVGGALLMAGIAAEKSGEDYKGLADSLQLAGGALTAVCFVAMSAQPIMKGAAALLHGTLAATLKEVIVGTTAHTAAMQVQAATAAETAMAEEALAVSVGTTGTALTVEAEQMTAVYASSTMMSQGLIDAVAAEEALAAAGLTVSPAMMEMQRSGEALILTTKGLSTAMRALVAATVIGAVVTAAYLIWQYFSAGTNAAKEYDAALKNVEKDLSLINAEQTVLNDQLKAAQGYYDDATTAIKDVTDAQQKNIDITEQQVKAQRTLRDAQWGQKDAARDLAEAIQSGDREAIERARRNKIHADEAVKDAREQVDTLADQKAANDEIIRQNKDIATLLADQAQYQKDQLEIGKQLEAINREKEDAEAMKEVIGWQKEGVQLTGDQLNLLMQSDSYAKALRTVPGLVTRNPDYLGTAANLLLGVAGAGGAAAMVAAGSLETREVTNPMFAKAGATPGEIDARQTVYITVATPEEAAATARGFQTSSVSRMVALRRAGYSL